jgi:translation initiation factor 1
MALKPPDRGRIVYDSDRGRMCPACRRPVAQCVCARTQAAAPARGDGVVRVRRETQGRKGKTVTTIAGVPWNEARLAELARELKQRCGAGGSLHDGVIEIQGDHRDRIVDELEQRGLTVRRAGG